MKTNKINKKSDFKVIDIFTLFSDGVSFEDFLSYLVYPYKPKNPLIHSILCYKLFANICKFLYLYTIILADIYA